MSKDWADEIAEKLVDDRRGTWGLGEPNGHYDTLLASDVAELLRGERQRCVKIVLECIGMDFESTFRRKDL
jgi:hypothetical protein